METREEIREEFLRYRLRTVRVNGSGFTVREMSGRCLEQAAPLIARMTDDESAETRALSAELGAIVTMHCLCDEDGIRLFGDDEIDLLRDRPLSYLETVFEAAFDLSGLGDDSGN